MKTQAQSKKLIEQQESTVYQTEQIATTATASEPVWVALALVMLALLVGIYWINDPSSDEPEPRRTSATDQFGAVSTSNAVSSDLISTGPKSPPKSALADIDITSGSVEQANEQLVRRFYDEVINRRQIVLMDELFAEQVVYRDSGPMATLSLEALKQQIISESMAYAGLHYVIEQVNTGVDWVGVDWSARGRPWILLAGNAPAAELGEQDVWSGYTVWKVVDGKAVQMGIYHAADTPPDRTGEDQVGQRGSRQTAGINSTSSNRRE